MRTSLRTPCRSIVLPAALLLCLSGALASCSNDEDSEGSSSEGGSADSSASGASDDDQTGDQSGDQEGDQTGEESDLPQLRGCRVTVDVTGDTQVSWEGEADVRITQGDAGSKARYSASKGNSLVTIYSPEEDIDYPAITFSQGEEGFSSVEDDAADIEVDPSGAGAAADLALGGLDGASIDVRATFTCDTSAKSGKAKAPRGSRKN